MKDRDMKPSRTSSKNRKKKDDGGSSSTVRHFHSNNGSATSIKGGGRAEISSHAEDLIVSLLYDLRNNSNTNKITTTTTEIPTRKVNDQFEDDEQEEEGVEDSDPSGEETDNDDNNNDHNHNGEKSEEGEGEKIVKLFQDLSAHDQKNLKRQFLTQLVRSHQRESVHLKFNSKLREDVGQERNQELHLQRESKDGSNHQKEMTRKKTKNHTENFSIQKQTDASSNLSSGPNPIQTKSGRVRIHIVEAIYTDTKTGKSKNSKLTQHNTSHQTSSRLWTEGTVRKTVVLPCTTSIEELYLLAKSKLRLRKMPIRCFCCVSVENVATLLSEKQTNRSKEGGESTIMEIDLLHDLSGLKDEDTVYVSLTTDATVPSTAKAAFTGNTTTAINTMQSNHEEIHKNNITHNHSMKNIDQAYEHNLNLRQSNESNASLNKDEDPLDLVKAVYHSKKSQRMYSSKNPSNTIAHCVKKYDLTNTHTDKDDDDSSAETDPYYGDDQEEFADKSHGINPTIPLPLFETVLNQLSPLSLSRQQLPISSYRNQILTSLDSSRVIIICGSTGCGKSTQVPQFILEGMNELMKCSSSNYAMMDQRTGRKEQEQQQLQLQCNILVTQPRRVAATTLATRICQERQSPEPGQIGSIAGYNIRLSRKVSESSRIVFCTVGILLRMLIDPYSTVPDDDSKQGDATRSEDSTVALSSISHVIIDEIHERDLNTDFAVTVLKPLLLKHKRLKVILMSATASVNLFHEYFHDLQLGIAPMIIQVPGRTYPVDVHWLPSCEKIAAQHMKNEQMYNMTAPDPKASAKQNERHFNVDVMTSPMASGRIDYSFITAFVGNIIKMQQSSINDSAAFIEKSKNIFGKGGGTKSYGKSYNNEDLIEERSQSSHPRMMKETWSLDSDHGHIKTFQEGNDILIFLPGKGEIESLKKTMRTDTILGDPKLCQILSLHSSTHISQQRLVFQSTPQIPIKIILATNVAETSITIPNVSVVIDTGLVKESHFNASTRTKELRTVWISKAAAKQRAGRSGRTRPGVCYKLYTQEFEDVHFLLHTTPEVLRSSIDEVVLQVLFMQENMNSDDIVDLLSPAAFLSRMPQPPSSDSVYDACELLLDIGAITRTSATGYRITPLGYHLAHLPVDPSIGKILITGCMLECIGPALTIAAALSASKELWLKYVPGVINSYAQSRDRQKALIQDGFGGPLWRGGSAKGDLIAVISVFNAWQDTQDTRRRAFAFENCLDHSVLEEIRELRNQFMRHLKYAGFLRQLEDGEFDDDALLTTCCLVSGLYPNVATLMRRSTTNKIYQAKLIIKDGSAFLPSASSFQRERILSSSESGGDVYAVFHSKHQALTAGDCTSHTLRPSHTVLENVNFVSRFSLLLFGGQLEVVKNYVVLDSWLKFKVGDRGYVSAILINELRKELDKVFLKHMIAVGEEENLSLKAECRRVINVVRLLVLEE